VQFLGRNDKSVSPGLKVTGYGAAVVGGLLVIAGLGAAVM
jgi:hypothetical protein